jgi:hypothetical protein
MTTKDNIIRMTKSVRQHPESIGVLSTGEACAVSLLLGRMDLAKVGYNHPLDAFVRLGPEWQRLVLEIHQEGILDEQDEAG